VILGGGWAGNSSLSLSTSTKLRLRLGMTGEHELATVTGWDMHVNHLDGSELLEHAARGGPGARACKHRRSVMCKQ
jgi:hypothetical protein